MNSPGSTEFIPDYLRWAEHIYGNLLEYYWSVHRSGGVSAKFASIKAGADHFDRHGPAALIRGFDEDVRNAIAHGQFQFTGTEIEFGEIRPTKYGSSEFLRLYDDLCRTANACGLALFIFWDRHNVGSHLEPPVPVSILARFAAGGLNRPGLKLIGAIESSVPGVGRQLHAALVTSDRNRTQVLGNCARVAMHLIDAGATSFDRMPIEVDQGESVSSLVVIEPKVLQRLIKDDRDFEPRSFMTGT